MKPYSQPSLLFNRHLETIYPAIFRKIVLEPYQRERIYTLDSDFIDLDWLKQSSQNLIIISHGLEGNSQRAYMKGMAKVFYEQGFDIMAWNYRGCSNEMNKQLRFYHSGATDDLSFVIDHASLQYDNVFLIGFSLGGNLTLKYLGEIGSKNSKIKKAVTFSVPMDLHKSCLQISQPYNWLYEQRFLKSLKAKVTQKSKAQPNLSVKALNQIRTLMEFDDHFTAPIHGFKSAIDYYTQSSSIHFLSKIKTPTLIVNAKNDPFLSQECYPDVNSFPAITFESPERGGHVGFSQFNQNGLYWSESRALEFITST